MLRKCVSKVSKIGIASFMGSTNSASNKPTVSTDFERKVRRAVLRSVSNPHLAVFHHETCSSANSTQTPFSDGATVAAAATRALEDPCRITVIGATGRIGSAVVAQALDKGMHVTAAVRDVDKARGSFGSTSVEGFHALGQRHDRSGRLTVEKVTLDDPNSMSRILARSDVVVFAAAAKSYFGSECYANVDVEGLRETKRLCELTDAHLIFFGNVLTKGAKFTSIYRPVYHMLFPGYLPASAAQQRMFIADDGELMNSSLRWSIVRCRECNIGAGTVKFQLRDASCLSDPLRYQPKLEHTIAPSSMAAVALRALVHNAACHARIDVVPEGSRDHMLRRGNLTELDRMMRALILP